jgi:hypothetical protein
VDIPQGTDSLPVSLNLVMPAHTIDGHGTLGKHVRMPKPAAPPAWCRSISNSHHSTTLCKPRADMDHPGDKTPTTDQANQKQYQVGFISPPAADIARNRALPFGRFETFVTTSCNCYLTR